MNLVTQKHAHELVANFRHNRQMPGANEAEHLPVDRALSLLETSQYNYDQLVKEDDSPDDICPGLGKVVTHEHQRQVCLQTCVDYWGDATDGEVSMFGQSRGQFEGDRHVYCRYTPTSVDSIEVEAKDDWVKGMALHLDRHHPQESTRTTYLWNPPGGPYQHEGFNLAP